MNQKIIIVTTSLSCGGITSFLIPLANMLSDEGHDVTLAYTRDEGDFLTRIRPEVHRLEFSILTKKQTVIVGLKNFAIYDMARIYLRKSQQVPHYASIQRLSYIMAKYINITKKHFDLAISTAEGFCNALVANNICASRKVGWVHPDMATLGVDVKAGKKIVDKLDCLVTVSEQGCVTLKKYFPNANSKIYHIDNLMDNESIRTRGNASIEDMPLPVGYKIIVTVCRITNDSKRLDRVVKVAKIMKDRGFKFVWYIVGDGPDYQEISKMIIDNGLESYVIMLGGKTNPLPYVKKADCFVLTSQYEGKPVVIEEAKILHTPVFVTMYSSAKSQVTKEFGMVVPNVDGQLEHMLADYIQNKVVIIPQDYEYDNSNIIAKINNIINLKSQ